MSRGKKTGGRTKGTPNKIQRVDIRSLAPRVTALAQRILSEAERGDIAPTVRAELFKTIAPYVLQKQPQAIEHSGGESPIKHEVRIEIVRTN